MVVEIGTSTLLGVAFTIFFSILGIAVSILYKISVNLQGIENSINQMDKNIGEKLDKIENNTSESAKLLHRISERTRQGGDPNGGNGGEGNEYPDTDGGTDIRTPEEGVIIDAEQDSKSDSPSPGPDTEHIDKDPQQNDEEDFEWEYGYHVLDRIEKLDKFTREDPGDLPEDAGEKIIEDRYSDETDQQDDDQHWVTEEAEDISFALSREIGDNDLYLSVAVGDEVSQVNYHIAQAGFPGLVGADPKQNKITKEILEAAQERYGDNAVLSVHSGQVVVSLPTTSLDDIREWVEDSGQIIEDIVTSDTSHSPDSDSTKKWKTE